MNQTFYIATFGCQMNAHDSEKIDGLLTSMNYTKTEDERAADIVVYNTCCVRENAENKVYGNLGYLKNLKQIRPNMKIVLCGCMMQQDVVIDKIKQSYRHVDVIFGTFNLHRLPELLQTSIETNEMIIDIWQEGIETQSLPTTRSVPFKASVNVMFGCNNFCTYCIVPYVRGRERSRKLDDVYAECSNLASQGVKEILLLGQNVNSYDNGSFPKLLNTLAEIDGIERIRFLTSHPKDLSDELIDVLANNPKLCKHIHLPFQAGSSRILKEMNRGYTKEDYLNLIQRIKLKLPKSAITTDIIVGFPTETEEDFLDTLDVVRTAKFAGAFTFIYSKRTGTKAASLPPVPEEVIKRRFDKLIDTLNPILLDRNQARMGEVVDVLVEETNDRILTGRTDDNALIHLSGSSELIGNIVPVRITGCKTFYLIGEKE